MSIVGKWFGFGRDERYDTGVRAFERGDFGLAAESFDACMSHTTDATTRRLARFYLGQCHAQLGHRAMADEDASRAVAEFRKALDLHPSYPDLHFQLATAYGAMGDAERQETELRLALEINPMYSEALLQLGVVQYSAGLHDVAMDTIMKAVRIGRGVDADKYRAVAEAHQAADSERVVELLAGLRVGSLSAPEQQVQLADRRVGECQFLEASHAYEAALALVPKYADVRCKYGQTLLELDRLDDAVEQFRAALAINPKYADAHAYLGIGLRRQGHHADAKESFKRALACNPDHPIALVEATRL